MALLHGVLNGLIQRRVVSRVGDTEDVAHVDLLVADVGQDFAVSQELHGFNLARGRHGVAISINGVIHGRLADHGRTLGALLSLKRLLGGLGHLNHLFHVRHGRGLFQQLRGIHRLGRVLVLQRCQEQLHEVVLAQLAGVFLRLSSLIGLLSLVHFLKEQGLLFGIAHFLGGGEGFRFLFRFGVRPDCVVIHNRIGAGAYCINWHSVLLTITRTYPPNRQCRPSGRHPPSAWTQRLLVQFRIHPYWLRPPGQPDRFPSRKNRFQRP